MSGKPESSTTMNSPPPSRVLLIAGSGRSGSTLIGMLLGSLDGFFNVGELRWFWSNFAADRGRCGCGSRVVQCEFWSSVATDLAAEGVSIDRIAAYTTKWGRTASLPRLLSRKLSPVGSREFEEYTAATRRLYEIVSERTGGLLIVDGSKLPPYVTLLQGIAGLDLRLLHLVRDGRAVAHAWHQRYVNRPPRGAADPRAVYRPASIAMAVWVAQNLLVQHLRQRQDFFTVVRYEDFCSHPEAELRRALTALGLDCGGVYPGREAEVLLRPDHSIGGSDRVRFEPPSRQIVLDAKWKNQMGSLTRSFVTLLGWPVLRRFGYVPELAGQSIGSDHHGGRQQ